MSYKPGDAYAGQFPTYRFDTGVATDADSTPTATATKNGTDDGAFALTVTKLDTGRYKVTGTIPQTYAAGDAVQISVAATVNSVAGKAVIDSFLVDAKRLADLNDLTAAAIVAAGYVAPASAYTAILAAFGRPVTINAYFGTTDPWQVLLYDAPASGGSAATPIQLPADTHIWAALRLYGAIADALTWDTALADGISLAFVGSGAEPARVQITRTQSQSAGLASGRYLLAVRWMQSGVERCVTIIVVVHEAPGDKT